MMVFPSKKNQGTSISSLSFGSFVNGVGLGSLDDLSADFQPF
jgi:hypothetical protein